MPRYIEENVVYGLFNRRGQALLHVGDIDVLPRADAVEVVHGRWVFGTANHREYMKCSECLTSQTPTGVFTYCPSCGAKMDGGNEDGK